MCNLGIPGDISCQLERFDWIQHFQNNFWLNSKTSELMKTHLWPTFLTSSSASSIYPVTSLTRLFSCSHLLLESKLDLSFPLRVISRNPKHSLFSSVACQWNHKLSWQPMSPTECSRNLSPGLVVLNSWTIAALKLRGRVGEHSLRACVCRMFAFRTDEWWVLLQC